MTLSERIRAAMAAADMSQTDLARACGVKPPSVHGWLTGKAKFLRGENLLRAARALGVSQDWLATGAGDMHQVGPIAEPENMAVLDAKQHEWLALREHLGSDDIAEFTTLIRARQERNMRLIEELENHLHSGRGGLRSSGATVALEGSKGKKQSSQSS